MLERALRSIPLGTQTFSKSYIHYPRGAAPFFVTRAQGSRVWDVDGNEYVDFVNALNAITLGHCDPDVSAAVQEQMALGTIFTLTHPIEIEVAEKIIELVPCAERVRFGKNGSDATAGCIRAARAFTDRDRVAVCGYHGWQDWYIGSTARNKGVPGATRALTHGFGYNDLASLEAVFAKYPGEFAAVILEPMNSTWPAPGFIEGVVELAHAHGALAVFDETITGFRFAPGGAQQYFGVTPDLSSFGKALANGYPLAAVAGRADVMREFEDVFFSFTMGGETLSLAAARAAMAKVQHEDVTGVLERRGKQVMTAVQDCIARHGCDDFLVLSGHPSWSFLTISGAGGLTSYDIRTLFLQEVFARGILTLGTHNMSFAHSEEDVALLVAAYDAVFPMLHAAVERGSVSDMLRCAPLEPLFKVR
jgi:glutamate-1-semialdehyde 2,1-aminomutase